MRKEDHHRFKTMALNQIVTPAGSDLVVDYLEAAIQASLASGDVLDFLRLTFNPVYNKIFSRIGLIISLPKEIISIVVDYHRSTIFDLLIAKHITRHDSITSQGLFGEILNCREKGQICELLRIANSSKLRIKCLNAIDFAEHCSRLMSSSKLLYSEYFAFKRTITNKANKANSNLAREYYAVKKLPENKNKSEWQMFLAIIGGHTQISKSFV